MPRKVKAGSAIAIDGITRDEIRGKLDDGLLFIASYHSPHASPVTDDDNIEVLLIVGATQCKLDFFARSGGASEIDFYEGTTVSNNGTGMTRANMNRASINNGTLQTFHSPTISADGTLLYNDIISSLLGGSVDSGVQSEWLLAANTNYLIRLTNRNGNDQELGIQVEWTE